jgi:phosphohistidine phosphatase
MVKNLLLIRHAEALPQAQDERDFQRVLSDRGVNQALLLGDYLSLINLNFDTLFLSPAERTIQTAKIISENIKSAPKDVITEEFYEATLNTMIASVNRLEVIHTNVIIVGHNPSIAALCQHLIGDQYLNFATAACAHIEFEFEEWSMAIKGSGLLKDFYYPGKMDLV